MSVILVVAFFLKAKICMRVELGQEEGGQRWEEKEVEKRWKRQSYLGWVFFFFPRFFLKCRVGCKIPGKNGSE